MAGTYHEGGLVVLTATMSSGPLTAALTARQLIAPGIADLVFAMRDPGQIVFQAGQFVSIAVGKEPNGATLRRSYSIASPSHLADRMRFIIRVIPEGAASGYLMSVPLGAEVRMTGPHGFFVLDAKHEGDVVFGATGTGVAAVMPMLQELAARPPEGGRRMLYWGVRHQADLFAREEIEALCRAGDTALHLYLSDPPTAWPGGRGRITAAILERLDHPDQLPPLDRPTFYLVGNGAMIGELKAGLIARGVNRKRQVRTESFFD